MPNQAFTETPTFIRCAKSDGSAILIFSYLNMSLPPYHSRIIPHELSATIIEIFHRFINGVEDNPIVPYGLFTLYANPFNLGVPEIFKMVVIIGVQFMFPHFDALLLR